MLHQVVSTAAQLTDAARNAVTFRKAPLDAFAAMAREGDVTVRQVAHERFVLLSDPALVRDELLHERHSRALNFEAPSIRDVLGEGSLTTDGAAWALARRIAGPPLAPRAVADLQSTLHTAITDRLDALLHTAGRPTPIFAEMTALTVRVTVEGLLGHAQSDDEARELADEVLFAQAYLFFWLGNPWLGVPTVPTRSNRRYHATIAALEALVAAVIAAPPASGFTRHLFATRTPDGEPLSEAARRDHLLTMLVAAPENTATTLSWALHLLSQHPEIQARLRAEGAASPFWTPVLHEVLRLYPGAPYIDRRTLEDTTIGGQHVPAGSLIFIAPYLLHRDPRAWDAPDTFRPERFVGRPEHAAWLPFGFGPRRCVGEHLAMMILRTTLPRILERFEVAPAPGYTASIDPVINLRPSGGLPLVLRPLA